MSLDIRKTIEHPVLRGVRFEAIAREVLGKKYELSLVVCGDNLAQRMNKQYRNKTYRPNVLSFPIAKDEGEIFLNVRCAEREAKRYNLPLKERLTLLFAHGCLHLKGLKHGPKMEDLERVLIKRFS